MRNIIAQRSKKERNLKMNRGRGKNESLDAETQNSYFFKYKSRFHACDAFMRFADCKCWFKTNIDWNAVIDIVRQINEFQSITALGAVEIYVDEFVAQQRMKTALK